MFCLLYGTLLIPDPALFLIFYSLLLLAQKEALKSGQLGNKQNTDNLP